MNCFWCFKPIDKGCCCGSPECLKHEREADRYERSKWWHLWRLAVKATLRDRCNNSYVGWQKWFYTFKCLYCLMVFRERPATVRDYPDAVEAGLLYSEQIYGGWRAGWIEVGYGIFSQWWFEIVTDSEINL